VDVRRHQRYKTSRIALSHTLSTAPFNLLYRTFLSRSTSEFLIHHPAPANNKPFSYDFNSTNTLIPDNKMPYIIRVPGVPQPYVTNDPRIYLDCLKAFNWECESRPFGDTYCQTLRERGLPTSKRQATRAKKASAMADGLEK
jgi:hypothetical protein